MNEPQITVYPVGLFSDLKRRRLRSGLRYLKHQALRGNWNAIGNYFNGYLAEVQFSSMHHTRCGHGWTRRRALSDLGRHLGKVNQ
ncbi:hypothetical protein ACORG1_13280 [Mycobacterium sp. TJFP1]